AFDAVATPAGELALIGQFGPSATFGATTLTGEDQGNQIFLAILDENDAPLAASSYGELGSEDHVRGAGRGDGGEIAAAGATLAGPIDFGGGALPPTSLAF